MALPDRISKTSMGKYNQVIALSQVMINEGLKTYWEKGSFEKLQKEMPASQDDSGNYIWGDGFSYSIMPNQYIANAIFGPPSIVLKPSSNEMSSIEYQLLIRSGVLQVAHSVETSKNKSSTSGPSKPKNPFQHATTTQIQYYSNYVIKDWKITVPVKMALRPLEPNTNEYKAAKALQENGNHTLHQLMVDTSSIGWESINITDMGTWQEDDKLFYYKDGDEYATTHKEKPLGEQRYFSKEPEMFQKAFEMHIKVCFQEFWRRGLNLFGTVSKSYEGTPAATFTVTDVRHQTYPYYDRIAKTNAPHSLGGGDLNYFLYLEMVDKNTPPDASLADAVIAPNQTNFTEGVQFSQSSNKSQFGTYMLSREVFLEGHILRKLEQFNRIMHLDIMKNEPAPDARFLDWYCTFNYVVHLGHGWQNENDAQKYKWTLGLPTINPKWEYQHEYTSFTEKKEGALIWHNIDDEWNTNAVYKKDWGVEAWSWGSTVTIQRVVVVPGSNVIKLEGMTIAKFNYTVDPSHFLNNWHGGFKMVARWDISLNLRPFSDGGIGIEVVEKAPTFAFTNLCAKDMNDGKHNLTEFKKALVRGYSTVETNFAHVVHDLKNSLKGQDRLTLPSIGVYIFENPLMNYKGDLVCEMQYNPDPFGNQANAPKKADRDTSAKPDAAPMQRLEYETRAEASKNDDTDKIKKSEATGNDSI